MFHSWFPSIQCLCYRGGVAFYGVSWLADSCFTFTFCALRCVNAYIKDEVPD